MSKGFQYWSIRPCLIHIGRKVPLARKNCFYHREFYSCIRIRILYLQDFSVLLAISGCLYAEMICIL